MEDGGSATYRKVKKMKANMWFRNAIQNAIWRRRPARGLKARQVRFEPLETRALLSASPAGGLDEPGTDPAVTVLAASPEGAPSSSWVDSLAPQQTQVRDGLHDLLSRGGTIDELEDFQPVPMPEAFLDELYETYGIGTVWSSLSWTTLAGLAGPETLISRGDTLVVAFPADSPAALEYDAGEYADNGLPDYFELTRSGDNLVLSIKEDTAPFDGQDLVTRATITLPIADVSQLKIKGSTDQDLFVISDLGDFAGLVSVEGIETDALVDSVQIYDTAGDDVWIAAEDYGVFQMQNAYTVTATDVAAMHGYASAGGDDQAYLYGNAKTNKVKTFDNETNLVRLYLGGFYHRAKFFGSVEIDGLGGVDRAILYGTPSDDLFTATKDEGSFTSPHGGGIDYSYTGFERVTARGGSGRDRAELSDSELADVIRLRPSKAWMSERGTSTPRSRFAASSRSTPPRLPTTARWTSSRCTIPTPRPIRRLRTTFSRRRWRTTTSAPSSIPIRPIRWRPPPPTRSTSRSVSSSPRATRPPVRTNTRPAAWTRACWLGTESGKRLEAA